MDKADCKAVVETGDGKGVSPELRWGFWLALLVVSGGLLYLLSPVLTPFLVAALLAYLSDPVVGRLQRRGLSRTLAVVVVFLVLFLGLLIHRAKIGDSTEAPGAVFGEIQGSYPFKMRQIRSPEASRG